jgi:hypothetical protein
MVLSGTLLPLAALVTGTAGAGAGKAGEPGTPGVMGPPNIVRKGCAFAGAAGAGASASAAGAATGSLTAPHWPQNFTFSGIDCPHWPQFRVVIVSSRFAAS